MREKYYHDFKAIKSQSRAESVLGIFTIISLRKWRVRSIVVVIQIRPRRSVPLQKK